MNKVQFSWAGKEYSVKSEVYQKDFIVLPDRKVLRSRCFERNGSPPKIKKLEEVQNPLQYAPVGEIAEFFGNAILASTVG